SGFPLDVIGAELGENTLGTPHGMDNQSELYKEAIPCGLNDLAVMLSDRLVDGPDMEVEQTQHARFIGAHLATEAHNIREHDGGQATGLSLNHRGYPLLQPRFA